MSSLVQIVGDAIQRSVDAFGSRITLVAPSAACPASYEAVCRALEDECDNMSKNETIYRGQTCDGERWCIEVQS